MSGYTANVIAHHGILDEDANFSQKLFLGKILLQRSGKRWIQGVLRQHLTAALTSQVKTEFFCSEVFKS